MTWPQKAPLVLCTSLALDSPTATRWLYVLGSTSQTTVRCQSSFSSPISGHVGNLIADSNDVYNSRRQYWRLHTWLFGTPAYVSQPQPLLTTVLARGFVLFVDSVRTTGKRWYNYIYSPNYMHMHRSSICVHRCWSHHVVKPISTGAAWFMQKRQFLLVFFYTIPRPIWQKNRQLENSAIRFINTLVLIPYRPTGLYIL